MKQLQNHVTLVGNIATEQRVTEFENGNKVVRFKVVTEPQDRIATHNRSVMQQHSVFAWGNIASFVEQFGKIGKKVVIHGRLVSRSYFTPQGEKQVLTEIEIRQILSV